MRIDLILMDVSAQLIDHLKKGDMAKEAERLLTDTGWLPEPLRAADAEFAMDGPIEGEGETRALPEFLTGDDDDTAEDLDEPQPHVIAAE